MPIIGYNAIGSEGGGWTPDSARVLYQVTATMTIDSVLGKGYLYCKAHDASGTDASNARMLIYEIGVDDANSPLVASSGILSISEQAMAWREFTFPFTILESGKEYAVAFVAGGDVGQGEGLDGKYNHVGATSTHRTESGVSINAPPSDLTGFGSMQTIQQTSVYAEYVEPPSHVTPGNLYAPVDAIPTVTDGRSAGHATGRDMKYALDNNSDTWWMPDDRGNNSLYVDLGVERTVDALALWLHNYNEAYDLGGKTWQIAYSNDDSSYIPLEAVEFNHGYRAVVLSAFEPTAARYWRVTFSDFDADPVGPYPEISAVWIIADYSLSWSHQRPESNKLLYLNNVSTTRSGHKFTSAVSVGVQRLIERRFVLTKNTGQWENLSAAYAATRGGGLPVVMKTELSSDAFYAATFDSPLVDNRFAGEYREPRLLLRELGFKRVPYLRKTLMPMADTLALWRFRGDVTDASGNGHDWPRIINGPVSYERGILENGDSVIDLSSNTYLSYNIGDNDVEAFHMGMNDFSIELWFNGTNLQQLFRQSTTNWTVPAGGYFLGISADKFRAAVGDGSNQTQSLEHGPVVTDGLWHYLTISVNRTTDELRLYVDGEKIDTKTTAVITGSIENASIGVYSAGVSATTTLMDEIHVIKGHAFTDAEVAARFIESVSDYGTWGM